MRDAVDHDISAFAFAYLLDPLKDVLLGEVEVSRPKEFHLRPLSEPDVNLSAHPAPIIHPTTDSPSTNGRMRVADVAPAV